MRAWCIVCAIVAGALAQSTTPGGDNMGIPLANSPVPYDVCSVASTNDADMRLNAVAWGYNNEFWVARQAENWGEMGAWRSIGGFFAGGPTVIRNANNDLVVFGRGADKKVWYKVLNEKTMDDSWVPLGGKLMSGRVSVVLDPQGLLHVFARGRDSAVWEKRQFANGTEALWGEWVSLGGVVSSSVAAIGDAEGIIHVFARGVDGFLWMMTQKLEDDGSLSWTGWTMSNNSIYLASTATIVAHLNTQNLVEVIVRGADKAFWHTRQAVNDERGVVWTPWKTLGGLFSSAPSIRINTDYLLTIFGRGPDKGVWYKQQAHHPVDSPSDSWSKWAPLGGRFSSGIDTAIDSRGYINIFGRGLDRSIWTRSQKFANHTVGFFNSWSSLGGRFRTFAC